MEKITIQDRAAIYYHVFANCNDIQTLFRIAKGDERFNKLSDSSKKSSPSAWWNKAHIKELRKQILTIQGVQENELKTKWNNERERETTESTKEIARLEAVNFLNLDEFLQYANLQANKIQDEKERRAWVEMIGKYMNFKETEEGETDIMRFYTPIFCDVCELKKRCSACKFEVCPIETL